MPGREIGWRWSFFCTVPGYVEYLRISTAVPMCIYYIAHLSVSLSARLKKINRYIVYMYFLLFEICFSFLSFLWTLNICFSSIFLNFPFTYNIKQHIAIIRRNCPCLIGLYIIKCFANFRLTLIKILYKFKIHLIISKSTL